MKQIFLCIIVLVSVNATAQTSHDSSLIKMNLSGIELAKFSKLTGIGTGCFLLGGGLSWAGAAQTTKSKGLIYGGAGLAALGIILNLVGLDHVTKASEYLRSNSIIIPLHK